MFFHLRHIALSLVLAACLTGSCTVSLANERATYELTFDATWAAETHPINFPPAPHFSGLIGATHNSNYSMWPRGAIATDGIESMTETGGRRVLSSEIGAQESLGSASAPLLDPGIGRSPGTRPMTVEVNPDLPLLSIVSMIAPSPDWSVGIHDFDLRPEGEWISHAVLDLEAYDAGTDSGANYISPNENTEPHEPIHRLTGGMFLDTPPLGRFELLRIVAGDFNQDAL